MLTVLGEKSFTSTTKIHTSMAASTIVLDFTKGQEQKRRSSFLPEELADEHLHEKGFSKATYCGSSCIDIEINTHTQTVTKFVTGSRYIGEWNGLGMAKKGLYRYPHGVIYDGHFNRNGEFHGSGILVYPNGERLEGFWKNGKLSPGASFVSKDTTVFNEEYCRMPDRRFVIEIETDLQPATQEYLTNAREPAKIPPGCYDAGDGFYDPKYKITRCYHNTEVFKPSNMFEAWMTKERERKLNMLSHQTPSETELIQQIMRWMPFTKYQIESIPLLSKEEWIKRYCRKDFLQTTGYRPELYEIWTTGSRKLNKELSASKSQDNSKIYTYNELDSFAVSSEDLSVFLSRATLERPTQLSLQALSTMFINAPRLSAKKSRLQSLHKSHEFSQMKPKQTAKKRSLPKGQSKNERRYTGKPKSSSLRKKLNVL